MISLILPKRELRQIKQFAQGPTARERQSGTSFCPPDSLCQCSSEMPLSLVRILFTALPGPEFQEHDPLLQQPLGSGHWGLGWGLSKQSSRKGSSSSPVPLLLVLPLPPFLRHQSRDRREPTSPGSRLEALPWHPQGPF